MPKYFLDGEKLEPQILLPYLYRDSKDGATLAVKHGCGNLMDTDIVTLTADGRLLLHSSIPAGLGLQIDADQCVVTMKECSERDL